MNRKMPVAVIAVVSDALARAYSHAQIDQFMESAGIEIAMQPIGNRQVKTRAWLKHANETMPDPLSTLGRVITELMEVGSPYESDPNESLRDKVSKIIHARDLSGLQTEFDRIYHNVESDPAAAVTASCALLESLFKTYIEEQSLAMPANQTLKPLWKVVRKDLKLDPAMVEDEDLKIILGGLAATVEGIGSIRTHKGSAHGRGKKAYKIEPRHARLAAHAAFTVATFILEVWSKNSSSQRELG
jgi:hypothetical protein